MSLESQLHELINKHDDLIHKPDAVYSLLARHDLLANDDNDDEDDNDEFENNQTSNKFSSKPKFIAVFDYLLDSSQVYGILKSMWKLNVENTSLISDCSLKTVLDWSWSRLSTIKSELNILSKLLALLTLFFI